MRSCCCHALLDVVRLCLLPCTLGYSEVVDVCCHALLDIVRLCLLPCTLGCSEVVDVCCHALLDVVRWSVFFAMHSWM